MLLIASIILFLFPGIYAYLSGRRFLGKEKTKAFAQEYFRYQQQSGMSFWLCFILSSVIMSFAIRSYPSFDPIWQNTWWLFYLIYFLAAFSAFITGIAAIQSVVRDENVPLLRRIGFNIAQLYLILWPYVFLCLAAFGKMKSHIIWSAAISAACTCMYIFYFHMWKGLMHAQVITDNPLNMGMSRILEAAHLDRIPMLSFPAGGLKFANAFFVGNYGAQKGVFISQFAFDNLTPDEVLAIYAHEIGHAQKHQVLRRSLALVVPFLLIITLNLLIPGLHVIYRLLVLIVGLVTMKLLVPSQKFEKEADLFALKAIGDTETVISSIEKIYELGILPERFAPAFRQAAANARTNVPPAIERPRNAEPDKTGTNMKNEFQ